MSNPFGTTRDMPLAVNGSLPVEVAPGRTLMEYSAGKMIYIGRNRQDALVGDSDWVVKKLFYSGTDLVDVQVLVGSWTGRASLSWKSSGGD